MGYYVYIIESVVDGSFYKGYSENPYERLNQHNDGDSRYTSFKRPWKLVCLLSFDTKREALIKERKLKKYSHESMQALIASNQNILRFEC